MNHIKEGDIIGQLKADFKKEPIKMRFIVVILILIAVGIFQSSPEKQTSVSNAEITPIEKTSTESIKTNNDVVQYEIPKAVETTFNGTTHSSNYVYVKYRTTPVDIGDLRFEYLDTSASSFVRGAWYDNANQYMVIKLNATYYHYCSMPKETWELFKTAASFGTFYNAYLKGNYDCRLGFVPEYEKQSSVGSYNYNWQPSRYSYSFYSDESNDRGDINVYGDCKEGSYCYGEDSNGNEVEIYVNSLDNGYGYGEDENGNEVEFYYDE